VVAGNLWEVISLLATCRKGGGMREEREDRESGFFPFFVDSLFQNEIS
jgi:hypothetical protein